MINRFEIKAKLRRIVIRKKVIQDEGESIVNSPKGKIQHWTAPLPIWVVLIKIIRSKVI